MEDVPLAMTLAMKVTLRFMFLSVLAVRFPNLKSLW